MRTALIATLMAGVACLAGNPPQVSAQDAFQPPPAVGTSAPDLPQPAPAAAGLQTPRPLDFGALAPYLGWRVTAIQFQGAPSILDPQRLLSLIPQKIGEPLDKRKLRGSIQALYATGRFQDVQAAVEPGPRNDLSLVFLAKQTQFVGPVALVGAPRNGPTERQLVNASRLQLGEALSDARLKQALAGILRALQDDGFYRAEVVPKLTPHPESQQVDVLFVVAAGERAHVGKINLTGDPGFSPEEVNQVAKLHPGDPASLQAVTRGLQRLRKKYQKQDRLEAQVALVSRSYQPVTNTVDYTLKVDQGPTVAVHVEGARLGKGVIKRNVPVYEENAVDDDLLNEGRRNLRDYLQTQGYFDAQVAVVRKQTGPEHTDIIYDVDRRERHKLVAVVFDGNKYFGDDLLRDRVRIQPAGWLLSYGLFSQSMLTRDVEAVISLYRSNGFLHVQVRPEVDDDYGKSGQMRVVLHIDEGPQTLVNSLKIVGNKTFSEDELQPLLSNIPGQPFSDSNMAGDHDALVNFYFNRGFPEVTMDYSAQPVPGNPERVDVNYTINEGTRVYVNQVLVSGLYFTRPFVVNREIVPHSGDPLSQADLLKTQSRLYDLGIFNGVDVAVQNPEGDETYKDVLVSLTEARRYTFDYGLGLEAQTGSAPAGTNPQGRTGVSPRVSFDVNRLNFRGRNDTIFFKSHFGRLQQRALVGYTVPQWLDSKNLRLTFNAFYDNTRDVFTFTAQRLEGSIQAEQSLSKATTLLYRMTYRNVKVDASTLQVDPNLIPLYTRPVRVGIPSFTFIRDTRDDPVDSHKGNYFVVDTGVASNALGSQTNFGRFLVQHSEYFAFGYKGRYILAHSMRLGIEQPWGGPNVIIPLPERFFAGGNNTLRGFALNEAGPRDSSTGFQIGGEAMFINNLELRLPPVPLPFIGRDMSPVIFHDMGNVYGTVSDVFPSLFRLHQPNQQVCYDPTAKNCSFNYNSQAVGGGIRYRTPIGPVRFDIGYNLNPPVFPIGRSNTFQRLHPVNYYFSIGQTF